jgi:tetratricopeptide (TPR) repeat protein
VHQFGVREVEKLLRLPRRTIHGLIRAGFVSPSRGPRQAYLFSFQDLIVLRTAQALAAANVPPKRITSSLRELRRHLPEAMPLSGLSICAVADRVVVKEGASRWQAESGQYLLAFEGDPAAGALKVIERRDWFAHALDQEEAGDAEGAIKAYEHATAADPALLDAHLNLGRLLHETGRLEKAERAYRDALKACGAQPQVLYQLGVLLEEMGRKLEAADAYEAALHADPRMRDCCYNLALLCEDLKRPREAIRYMAQYRRLVSGKSP